MAYPKVLFCQFDFLEYYSYLLLSTQLKGRGIGCEVEIIDNDRAFLRRLESEFKDVEVLGFHCSNVDYNRILSLAKEIKRRSPRQKIILGGPHPTLNPESIDYANIDFACVGAGEPHFADWVLQKGYRNKENFHNIVCDIGKSYEPVFITDLDGSPPPDYDIYYQKYHYMRDAQMRRFIFSTGCPYNCSYCYNVNFREKFKDKYINGVVFKSPAKAIDEIKTVLKKYPATGIVFLDDNFCINKKWLFEFLDLYHKEINLPFNMNSSVTTLSDDVIAKLVEAPLKIIRIAIETTNARIRRDVLNRPFYDNGQFSRRLKKLHSRNVRVILLNMFCLPTQTLDDCIEAFRFANSNKVLMYVTILVPFKGTRIYQYCLENNLLKDPSTLEDMFGRPSLKGPEMDRMMALHNCTFILNRIAFLMPAAVSLSKYKWFQIFSYKYLYKINVIAMHIPIYHGLCPFHRFLIIGIKTLIGWGKRRRSQKRIL